jgi:hypothetical protein
VSRAIGWHAADRAAVRRLLEASGLMVGTDGAAPLRGGVITILPLDRGRTDRLTVDGSGDAAADEPFPRLVGVGFATVDAVRAFPEGLVSLPGDEALGAFAWRVEGSGEPPLVAVEPSTEGTLAGALARHGEGPIALWIAGGTPSVGARLRRAVASPFGAGRLVEPLSRWGPFLILVEA